MDNQSKEEKEEQIIGIIVITHQATADIPPDDKAMGEQEENKDPRKRPKNKH